MATYGAVYDLETTNASTPNVDNPEAYTGTDEYDQIRQTTISLRPADK